MLDKLLSSFFDEEHEFKDIWELKLIKFDTELSTNLKPYEKYLAISDMVEDSKGNPGVKGVLFLSNLRLVWHSLTDKDLNLSIGLDTINNIILKSMPAQGQTQFKHILTVKAISPNQIKYEFKFAGFAEKEEKIFKKVNQAYKKIAQTKFFRNIDTAIKLDFQPLQGQEVKTRYNECMFEENEIQKKVVLILTNVRLVIIHQKIVATNYGIPWIMIEQFSRTSRQSKDALEVKIRGLLKNIEIYISCLHRADFSKLHKQIVSFCQTYNKNPSLGVDFSLLDLQPTNQRLANWERQVEIQQIEQTRVNIGRRKNAYGDKGQKGSLREASFNQQLGVMMQRMPEGCSRKDLWQILRT